MSTTGRPLILASLAALAATLTVPAQAAPFAEATTGLRCHYRLASDPLGTTTAFTQADVPLRGYWQNSSVLPSRSLFFTDTSPARARQDCEAKIATIKGAGALVAVGAATNDRSYNYEIWYNGDLAPGKPVERIVSFGDSLSDTGNMHNASQWQLPGSSWFLGRFSNGPTWIEHLAARTGLTLNNWAIGGAQTRDAQLGLIHGVDKQIDGFFKYMAHAKGYDPSRTLFTFLASGNDFVNDTKTAPQIVALQEASLRKLIDKGARKILIVNLPDVSVAPVFKYRPADVHTVVGKVEHYNHQIGLIAERLSATTGAEIRVVNARAAFDEIIRQPQRFGFVNTTDSCLQIDGPSSLNYIKKQKLRPGCDPSAYVFWDTLHPTTRTHELMAGWAIEATPVSWGLRK